MRPSDSTDPANRANPADSVRPADTVAPRASGVHVSVPVAVEVLDSIAYATPAMAGAVIVSGSHGGMSAARYAAGVRPRLVVFNDAGGGLDDAGFSGLALLEAQSPPVAAATVAHHTARIGEAQSSLDDGVVSHANAPAQALGVRVGMRCKEAVELAAGADARAAREP